MFCIVFRKIDYFTEPQCQDNDRPIALQQAKPLILLCKKQLNKIAIIRQNSTELKIDGTTQRSTTKL